MESASHNFPKPFSELENAPLNIEQLRGKHTKCLSLIGHHRNLITFINKWLEDDTHSLLIAPAIDDESDKTIGISIIPRAESEELHAVYITYEELNKAYSNLPSLADYASLPNDPDLLNRGHIDVDDDNFNAALGFDAFELLRGSSCPTTYAFSGTPVRSFVCHLWIRRSSF